MIGKKRSLPTATEASTPSSTNKRDLKTETKRQAAIKANEVIKDYEKKLDKEMCGGEGTTKGGAIDVMLAHNYDPSTHDCKGWLASEKLDGVRCYWNGRNLYTRNGNMTYAPDAWKAKLPNIALDGELWSGRDQFQSIVSTVRKQDPEPKKWEAIKFMVFDGPSIKGDF